VDERERIEGRLALIDRVDRPVAITCGVVVTVIYFVWRLVAQNHISTVTWMIAFFIGTAIPYFITSVMTERLLRRRRELEGGILPAARLLDRPPPPPPAYPPALRPDVPIERVEQTPLTEAPRLLK
jgi:hypothetical protein